MRGRPQMQPAVRFPDFAGDIRIDARKLIARARKNRETGCWTVVSGGFHRQGYPMLGAYRLADQKVIMTTGHRAMKKLEMQSDLAGYQVYHTCSNLQCINPRHLALGDQCAVMQNMVANDRYCKRHRPHKPRTRSNNCKNRKYSDRDRLFLRHSTQAEAQALYPTMKPQHLYQLRHNFRKAKFDYLDNPNYDFGDNK